MQIVPAVGGVVKVGKFLVGREEHLETFFPRRTRRGAENTLTPFLREGPRRRPLVVGAANFGRGTRESGETRHDSVQGHPAFGTFEPSSPNVNCP